MDFAKAVDAHLAWIMKLQEAIGGGEKLDPGVICKDDLCELGKWIYGAGAVYQSKPCYESFKSIHAHFHQCAADVVSKVNAGDMAGALAMVDTGGVLITLSSETVSAILTMKKELGL